MRKERNKRYQAMKFKYSAFTENTPEMREWLENIGYKLNIFSSMEVLPYIFAEDGVFHLIDKSTLNHVVNMEYVIDCLSNPPLFQAVTAIREDSDYMQLFYIDVLYGIGGQMVGSEPKKRFWSICKNEKQEDTKKIKATLEELLTYLEQKR